MLALAAIAGAAYAQGFGSGAGIDDLRGEKGTGHPPPTCALNFQFDFTDKCHLGAWMFR